MASPYTADPSGPAEDSRPKSVALVTQFLAAKASPVRVWAEEIAAADNHSTREECLFPDETGSDALCRTKMHRWGSNPHGARLIAQWL
jgi:hypothetical protein